jgi:peptidoglycan biosynthesis protein MviN/MurJ (putative lipid II flippase)
MLVGTFVVAVSIPVYMFLVQRWDVVGLATASSIAMTLSAVTTIGVYRWRTGNLPLGPIFTGLGRGALVAMVAGAAAWGTRWYVEPLIEPSGTLEWLLLGVAMGAPFLAVVLGISTIANFDEIDLVTSRLKRLARRVRR